MREADPAEEWMEGEAPSEADPCLFMGGDDDDPGVCRGATIPGKSCEPVAGWGSEEEGV